MLEELSDSSIEIQRQWLRFMLERVGHGNLAGLLEYYVSLGWISRSVPKRLLELARREKHQKGTSWTLSAREHRISMLFIEKLMGRHVDDSLLPISGKRKAELIPAGHRAKHLEEKLREFEKMKFMVHRREVTIKNLEQGLEDRDTEIVMLKEKLNEVEEQLKESLMEEKKNKIYREVLEENIRLKKI